MPGCAGKGVVDLMLVYPDGLLGASREVLEALGFQRQTTRDPFPEDRPMRTGSVVVETIFGIPGVGRYFVEAALNRDYTLSMGAVILVATAIIVINLIVDVAYVFIDPRVRLD